MEQMTAKVNRTKTAGRDRYFQMMRGLCICAVILIHCYVRGDSDFDNSYLIFIRNLENFAVGVFLFMAGYFAKPRGSWGGQWARLKKLLIPFLLWGIFFETIDAVSSREFHPLKVAYHIVSGRSSAQMYYIIVLIELMIITPLLRKALESRVWSTLILCVTPVYLFGFSILHYYFVQRSDWIGRDFAAWIMYYYIGMLLQRYGWRKRSNVHLLVFFIAAYVLSVIEGFFALRTMGIINIAVSQLKLSCMLYIVAVIFLAMNNRNDAAHPVQGCFAYIGDRSYGIFYVHTFVLKCVTWLLKKAGALEGLNLPIIQIVQFVSVLALSVLVIEVAHKIDKKGKLCWLIGF